MRIKIFLLIVLFSASMANAQEMRLDWRDGAQNRKITGYRILVGDSSRNYSQEKRINGKTLAINISTLPLKSDAANYISAIVDGEHKYSTEIVILWTGDNPDSDEDGLSDSFEKRLGTNPDKKDSDNDGIPDGEEYATWGPIRSLIDYDEDGMVNLIDSDSDGDGVPDGEDSDIRRIPSLFKSSTVALNKDESTFIHFYQRRKIKSEDRDGDGNIDLSWSFEDGGRGMRYRIYSRTDDEKYYDYQLWEVETSLKKATVTRLEKGKRYHLIVRALYPNGGLSPQSKELSFTMEEIEKKRKKKAENKKKLERKKLGREESSML